MSSEVDRVLAWETSSDSASVPESLTNLLRLAEEAGEEHAALAGNPEADVSELNALARQAENLTTGEEPEQEAKIVFDGLMGYHAKLERDRSELAIAAERRQFAHASNASNAASTSPTTFSSRTTTHVSSSAASSSTLSTPNTRA